MGIYYVEAVEVLQAAGVECRENSINAGWQSRARSSGGFPSAPKGIVWHHTASNTSPESDLGWMINGCDDAPVGNMLLDNNGIVWMIAAGASNCAGKGGPVTFSRGTVAQDSGNTGCWNIECANSGVGEPYSQACIDSYFKASNALNAHFGNQPYDVVSHQFWAPDRKIDPATAAAVQGPWRPSSINSSGTWNQHELEAECIRRAGTPGPPPDEEDDMKTPASIWLGNGRFDNFVRGNDGALWHNWWPAGPAGGYTPWHSLGGQLISSPSVSGEAGPAGGNPARIDVTAMGTDGAIWHIWWHGSDWSGWERLADWP